MMKKMDALKKVVNEKTVRMTFEKQFVSKENPLIKRFLKKIRAMNPSIIDWCNIPDYLDKKECMDLAKKMSGPNTIHYMHFMFWWWQVPGAFITDYPKVWLFTYADMLSVAALGTTFGLLVFLLLSVSQNFCHQCRCNKHLNNYFRLHVCLSFR